MPDWTQFRAALIAGDARGLSSLVQSALNQDVPAGAILDEGLIAGMDIVGEKMANDEIFIPEVMVAARAMSAAIEVLKPQLAAEGVRARGRVVIGTVRGDIHDIGKNLVAMMLESAGFEVHNLGVDVAEATFVREIRRLDADLLCLSALLSTTMAIMQETIQAVAADGLRDRVKIMVGGAPVTADYAEQIGANGYAPDAASAARLARVLVGDEG